MSDPSGKMFMGVESPDASDRMRFLKGKPWTFYNLLPFPVKVYAKLPVAIGLVGIIPPNGKVVASKTKSGLLLEATDISIDVTYAPQGDGGPEYEILRSEFLQPDSRMVRIGDVGQRSENTTSTIRSHADISGLRIHNRIGMAICVHYQGHAVATIDKDDGTSFSAGAPNSVFLNNNGNGFKVGDVLGFSIVMGPTNTKKYCEIMINDNYASDIFVGLITQKFDDILNDFYGYRIDQSSVNGLRYFTNYTAYTNY